MDGSRPLDVYAFSEILSDSGSVTIRMVDHDIAKIKVLLVESFRYQDQPGILYCLYAVFVPEPVDNLVLLVREYLQGGSPPQWGRCFIQGITDTIRLPYGATCELQLWKFKGLDTRNPSPPEHPQLPSPAD